MFYHNWDEQIDLMTEAELRNFIKNLIRYDKGENVVLNTKEEKLCWLGIVSGLEINKQKWITKSENGKLGGAPIGNKNAIKEKQPVEEKTSSRVPTLRENNLKQPKTTETSVNSKVLIDNSKLKTEKSEQEKGNETCPGPEEVFVPSKNFQVDFYNLPAEIKRIVLSEYMKIPQENRPTLELYYNNWEHQLLSSTKN